MGISSIIGFQFLTLQLVCYRLQKNLLPVLEWVKVPHWLGIGRLSEELKKDMGLTSITHLAKASAS